MEAILRIALDDGGDKWVTGTILAAYPLTQELGPGEKCGFLCVKVNTKHTLAGLRAMRLKKKISVNGFLSPISIDALRRQKEKLVIEILPKFHKVVELDSILSDTPEWQWPDETLPEGF